MPQLQMLENVLKPKETPLSMLESTFLEDWDENGQKVHLLPEIVKEPPIFSYFKGILVKAKF